MSRLPDKLCVDTLLVGSYNAALTKANSKFSNSSRGRRLL